MSSSSLSDADFGESHSATHYHILCFNKDINCYSFVCKMGSNNSESYGRDSAIMSMVSK